MSCLIGLSRLTDRFGRLSDEIRVFAELFCRFGDRFLFYLSSSFLFPVAASEYAVQAQFDGGLTWMFHCEFFPALCT
jgi:hypothetical protein